MPETGLWTDGAVRRGSPQGYGLNQRSSVAGRSQTTLGERTAQPSLSIGRVSQPSMFVSIDDDGPSGPLLRSTVGDRALPCVYSRINSVFRPDLHHLYPS
jgi:hypothetical protein